MAETPQINISRIDTETLRVPIIGTSPLIVNKFSEKSKRQMLAARSGAAGLANTWLSLPFCFAAN